jgi:hypothetical protein
MSEQRTPDDIAWPTHCPSCGTELQTHVTGFTPRATADSTEGVSSAVVAEDFCPNPDCPSRTENAPGSMGGDNGGA